MEKSDFAFYYEETNSQKEHVLEYRSAHPQLALGHCHRLWLCMSKCNGEAHALMKVNSEIHASKVCMLCRVLTDMVSFWNFFKEMVEAISADIVPVRGALTDLPLELQHPRRL